MQKIHIKLKEGQKIWFTSDLHFGHRNIIRFCNRPFADIKEMGQKLIENWNYCVKDDDIVFVLGDTFWFNDSRGIKKTLSQLNGEIYILPGNHDDFSSYHRVDDPRIHLCADIVTCWITEENKPKRELYLQHCPASTWPHRENGVYHLFGHIHSQPGKTEGFDQDLPLHWNQMDVGCDRWDYCPISLESIHLIMDARKEKKELR
jgi:calcineurin-like phosphoesterase family protein